MPVGPEVPLPLREYFTTAVADIAAQLGPDFTARLAFYGVTPVVPSGVPGDPAKDFQSSRQGIRGRCGKFLPGSYRPYSVCPLPGEAGRDSTARDCCRHYAFCVPYSKLAMAVEDRVSTVVASPRIARLPEEQWKAILAHELGHAIDFYLFGKRYRLRNHAVNVSANDQQPTMLLTNLAEIDEEPDPELRADAFGELLVLKPRNQKLCYDPVLTLQTLTDPSDPCDGNGNNGEHLMRHYTHAPLQGSVDGSQKLM